MIIYIVDKKVRFKLTIENNISELRVVHIKEKLAI